MSVQVLEPLMITNLSLKCSFGSGPSVMSACSISKFVLKDLLIQAHTGEIVWLILHVRHHEMC